MAACCSASGHAARHSCGAMGELGAWPPPRADSSGTAEVEDIVWIVGRGNAVQVRGGGRVWVVQQGCELSEWLLGHTGSSGASSGCRNATPAESGVDVHSWWW